MPPIALLSDFGEKDYYVGAMKGSILSINPEAQIVDITHYIPKQNVLSASFILTQAAEAFPENSIFVAEVNTKVEAERRNILLRTKNKLNFLGPDNGIFTLVMDRYDTKEVREITNKKIMRKMTSGTFHGRDITGPAAAHLSLGMEPEQVGPKTENLNKHRIEEPKVSEDEIQGKILHIDDFGNLVTNIKSEQVNNLFGFGQNLEFKIDGRKHVMPFKENFDNLPKGSTLCYIGDSGYLEIAKNQGNFAGKTGAQRGDELNIKSPR